jgi:hypothetical protein
MMCTGNTCTDLQMVITFKFLKSVLRKNVASRIKLYIQLYHECGNSGKCNVHN